MKKILFRGKRIDNFEWIDGYFVNIARKNSFIFTGKIDLNKCIGGHLVPEMHAVFSESVGQFTGLTDKNGKKIFEGDIVRCVNRNIDEDDGNALIEWDKECSQFEIAFNSFITDFTNIHSYELEVIGNMSDNPELLEFEVE